MSEKNIEWEHLKTIYRSIDSGRGKWGYEIRIGNWRIDGYPKDITLEKRVYEKTDSGRDKWGATKGLSKADVFRILDNAQEIANIMRIALPPGFSLIKKKQQELISEDE